MLSEIPALTDVRLGQTSGVTGFLNRMMNRTMDGVVVFDDVGRIRFVNPAFARLIGQAPSRLVRHSFLALVRESERAGVIRRWRGLTAGGEETYRVHLRTVGLGERQMVIVQHRLELGEPIHLAYVRDVSESAELSRQMHELQGLASLARAFDHVADVRQMTEQVVRELAQLMGVEKCYISLHDPVTDIVEPLAPAYGIGEADLRHLRVRLAESGHLTQIVQLGQPRISNDAAQDSFLECEIVERLAVRSLLTVPLSTGRRTLGFITVINRYGGGFFADDVRPLQIFAGQVAVLLDNARLIGELADEKNLALARAGQLEALVNNMVDGVFLAAADGQIIKVNTAGLRLTGLTPVTALVAGDGYIQQLALRELDGRPLAAADLPWRRALAGETVLNQEILLRPVDRPSEIVISVNGAPVYAADGSIGLAMIVARDVTELRELQRHKDEFLSMASHELRTPLTSLRGYTQQVIRQLERGDEFDRGRAIANLQRVLRQVDRLAGLTGDLVDVARLETGHLTLTVAECDLVALTSEVLDRFRASPTGARHRLRLAASAPVLVGRWDAARLEQVVTNLIDNAIKYSPPGSPIEVGLAARSGAVLLLVRDRGIGIPKEQIARLFQAFYRVDSPPHQHVPGLGLGLHIAHEIVRLHGGTIAVESAPGQGSLFSVRLPRPAATAPDRAAGVPDQAAGTTAAPDQAAGTTAAPDRAAGAAGAAGTAVLAGLAGGAAVVESDQTDGRSA